MSRLTNTTALDLEVPALGVTIAAGESIDIDLPDEFEGGEHLAVGGRAAEKRTPTKRRARQKAAPTIATITSPPATPVESEES